MRPRSFTMCFRSVAVHLVPRVLCLSSNKQGIRFGVPLADLCQDGGFPEALEDLCLLAHKESTLVDIFEKPVFPEEICKLKEKLGKQANLKKFSPQAITAVLKDFLMELPGGIFGHNTEEELLKMYSLKGQKEKINWSKKVLSSSLPSANMHLTKLLFSVFHSMVLSSPRKIDTFTQIALHFIPCLFHTTAALPDKILPAASVIAAFIENFYEIFDQNMTGLETYDNRDVPGVSDSSSLDSVSLPAMSCDYNNLSDLSKLLYEDHEVVKKLRPNTGFYTITYNLEN